MPAVAGAANDRNWGNHDRRSRGNDNWRRRGDNNWRARGNDDRTIRTAPSKLVAMKARPTAALGSGAIDGDEREQDCGRGGRHDFRAHQKISRDSC
jgi:hypothetical protein